MNWIQKRKKKTYWQPNTSFIQISNICRWFYSLLAWVYMYSYFVDVNCSVNVPVFRLTVREINGDFTTKWVIGKERTTINRFQEYILQACASRDCSVSWILIYTCIPALSRFVLWNMPEIFFSFHYWILIVNLYFLSNVSGVLFVFLYSLYVLSICLSMRGNLSHIPPGDMRSFMINTALFTGGSWPF